MNDTREFQIWKVPARSQGDTARTCRAHGQFQEANIQRVTLRVDPEMSMERLVIVYAHTQRCDPRELQ